MAAKRDYAQCARPSFTIKSGNDLSRCETRKSKGILVLRAKLRLPMESRPVWVLAELKVGAA